MATPDDEYYTHEMMLALASVPNKHNVEVDIMEMGDDEGPYLAILIDYNTYVQYGVDEDTARSVSKYLFDIRKALQMAGARVTYLVVDNSEG